MATIRTALPRSLTLTRTLIRPTPSRFTIPRPRQFTTCRISQNNNKMASTKAQESAPSFEEKLTALNGFLDKHKTMAIADKTKDMKVRFIYDRDSYKETEIDNDAHVNIGVDASEKNDGWVSIAGKARIVTDNGLVAKLYNPSIKAWFGDKGDGVHTGGPEDPRMAVIEVVPDEIRHYHQERSGLGVLGEVVAATITGNTASPGSIRTITREELATVA